MSANGERPRRRDLERMRADVLEEIAELEETLAWLEEEIEGMSETAVPRQDDGRRGYSHLDPAELRTYVRQHGPVDTTTIARDLAVSIGQVRYRAEALFDLGTLVRVRKGNRILWSIAKPTRRELRAKPKAGSGPRVVSGVAGTGLDRERRAINARRRKGYRT